MIPIITSAIGQKYVDCVKKFIEENPNQEIYLLTNVPEEFPTIKNKYYYFNPIFNYFDNFIFGLQLINRLKMKAFLWHADQLEDFHKYKDDFDTESDIIQYRGGWGHGSTFEKLYNHSEHTKKYWTFFKNYLTQKREIKYSNEIKVLWEAHFFLPKLDYFTYNNVINDLYQLKKIFTENSNKKSDRQDIIEGNGEGLAVGYSFWKNRIVSKDVMKYHVYNVNINY